MVTEKVPYEESFCNDNHNHTSKTHLHEEQLLRSNLPNQGLKFGSTNVVFKRAKVELRSRTIKNADAKFVVRIIPTLFFTNGDTMSGLLVGEEFRVYKGSVCVDFIEFPREYGG